LSSFQLDVNSVTGSSQLSPNCHKTGPQMPKTGGGLKGEHC